MRNAICRKPPQRQIQKRQENLIKHRVDYLGAHIHQTRDTESEITATKAECMKIWKRLGMFWKESNCSSKVKLITYNAIVRSKLMHSLDSAVLTPTDQQKHWIPFNQVDQDKYSNSKPHAQQLKHNTAHSQIY